eukprot:m.96171 g.96171  ORF g.96171 m.96171 type:complete len:178 (+) comp13064_c0_seq2:295-828(+)
MPGFAEAFASIASKLYLITAICEFLAFLLVVIPSCGFVALGFRTYLLLFLVLGFLWCTLVVVLYLAQPDVLQKLKTNPIRLDLSINLTIALNLLISSLIFLVRMRLLKGICSRAAYFFGGLTAMSAGGFLCVIAWLQFQESRGATTTTTTTARHETNAMEGVTVEKVTTTTTTQSND